MTKAQQSLIEDIEKIEDDDLIEKVRIFIMGVLAQQRICEQSETEQIRNQPKQLV